MTLRMWFKYVDCAGSDIFIQRIVGSRLMASKCLNIYTGFMFPLCSMPSLQVIMNVEMSFQRSIHLWDVRSNESDHLLVLHALSSVVVKLYFKPSIDFILQFSKSQCVRAFAYVKSNFSVSSDHFDEIKIRMGGRRQKKLQHNHLDW